MEIKCLIKHKVAVADFHDDLPQSVYSSKRSRPFCDSNQISAHKFWHVVEVITFRRVLLPLCMTMQFAHFCRNPGLPNPWNWIFCSPPPRLAITTSFVRYYKLQFGGVFLTKKVSVTLSILFSPMVNGSAR